MKELVVELDQNYDFTASTIYIDLNWRHIRKSSQEVDREYSLLSKTLSKSSCPQPETVLDGPSAYSTSCAGEPLEIVAFTTGFVSLGLLFHRKAGNTSFIFARMTAANCI